MVPGGGLAPGGERWIGCRPGFFLPVKVLSRLFRRLFLEQLDDAFARGQLRFSGSCAGLAEPDGFAGHLAPVRTRDWVVYAKPPFGGPEQVWSISAAIPTGSRSPPTGWRTWRRAGYASTGRTTGITTSAR